MENITILVTGFDPFGGELTNPSFEAAKLLPNEINNAKIIKKEIPTIFYKSKDLMISYINEYKPNVILNVGQAGGRSSISIEKQAYNLIQSSIQDNNGNKPNNIKISTSGKDILISTLPINEMINSLKRENIASYISESAGRFVCNYIMYTMLEETYNTNIISGFIHVPFSKEQVTNKKEGTPYMEIPDMTKALKICLESIINYINNSN